MLDLQLPLPLSLPPPTATATAGASSANAKTNAIPDADAGDSKRAPVSWRTIAQGMYWSGLTVADGRVFAAGLCDDGRNAVAVFDAEIGLPLSLRPLNGSASALRVFDGDWLLHGSTEDSAQIVVDDLRCAEPAPTPTPVTGSPTA